MSTWALHDLARLYPKRPALVAEDGTTFTLGALDLLARRAQTRFAGRDVVALQGDNGPELVVAFLGALYAGAAVHPLHADTPPGELARRGLTPEPLPDLDAFAATPPAPAPVAAPAQRPALLLSTSGTTGAPADVVIGHGSLATHTLAVARALGLEPDDRVLGALPLAHSFGCRMALLAPLVSGAVVHVVRRFSARATLACMSAQRLTWIPAVPTMFQAWAAVPLADAPRPTSVRWCLSAGAPLTEATRLAAEARLGADIRQGYGLSEASFACIDAPPAPRTPGSVGRPVPGVEVRIAADGDAALGEVLVRGANLMLGYRSGDGPEPTLAPALSDDGWLATGDLGRLDAEGRLFIVDRKKDIVLVGGHTVHPAEVEAVLHDAPGVAAVAVYGRPDPFYGEALAAAIVPTQAAAPPDPDALAAWARARLAPFKVPTRWRSVAALPLGPSGKVLRRVLRDDDVRDG